MSGKAAMETVQYVVCERRPGPRRGCGRYRGARGSSQLFGLDLEEMSPKAQVVSALAVLAPVALSGVLLVSFAPGLWWIFTTYFWVAFPAFGLLVRGISGLSERQAKMVSARSTGERELLEALRRESELTPARAAMETSLSVAAADAMLKGLTEAGHLEVRVRGGGLFYALWEGAKRPALEENRAKSGKTAS
ncbi:MAG: hypothetical protein AVDCRST_MAG78-389 [uncultured Rubrobacteraceae bacterium]|uniref:Uncharacterized protein n=1 Tax=uncultured Rubrobacteraceae bacterium TaxID=349277 RepID=A0A6J4PDB2_9ACTN|nr:MAG: hypothetical protein AVDCRST_MAG78-389 [uncultured Rubrobacteraceae bacterium]